jgi:hypothetical protein
MTFKLTRRIFEKNQNLFLVVAFGRTNGSTARPRVGPVFSGALFWASVLRTNHTVVALGTRSKTT